MKRSVIFVFLILAGCSEPRQTQKQPEVIAECAGNLLAHVIFPQGAPSKIRIDWRTQTVLDECTQLQSHVILTSRDGNTIQIDEGGFGYTAISPVSFKIMNCETNEEVFAITDYVFTDHEPQLCEPFDLSFEAN